MITSGQRLSALRLLALAGFASLANAPSAMAKVSANGSVTVVDSTGVGVAYDVQTQMLTSISISGRRGEPVSIQSPEAGPGFELGSQMVWDADTGVLVLSADVISVKLVELSTDNSGSAPRTDASTLIILAQFN